MTRLAFAAVVAAFLAAFFLSMTDATTPSARSQVPHIAIPVVVGGSEAFDRAEEAVVPSAAPSRAKGSPIAAAPSVRRLGPAGLLHGQATWWASWGHGQYVALRPDLGTKGLWVVVCGGSAGYPWHCVTAPVTTTCACLGPHSRRIIDLSADIFAEFAPLSRGVIDVTVQILR